MISDITKQLIIEGYKSGLSLQTLGNQFGYSRTTIKVLLVNNGIKIREKGAGFKTYPTLTEKEKQIILGTLIGDAHISHQKKTFSLQITHGPKQLDYLQWLCDNLPSLKGHIHTSPKYDKRNGKTYITNVYYSLSHPYFNELYDLYYSKENNRIKDVNEEILSRLSEQAIAIWYLDDGSLRIDQDGYNLTFWTNSESDRAVKLIIKFFKEKYGLTFHKAKDNALFLTSLRDILIFMDYIEPFIPECMAYKTMSYYIKNTKDRNFHCHLCHVPLNTQSGLRQHLTVIHNYQKGTLPLSYLRNPNIRRN